MSIEGIRNSKFSKCLVYMLVAGLVIYSINKVVGLIQLHQIDKEFKKLYEKADELSQQRAVEFESSSIFYAQVDSLVGINKQKEAIELIYQRIDEYPEREAYLLHEIGLIYAYNGEIDSAIVKFSEAINLNSIYVLALGNRAQCYLEINSLNLAISDLESAAKLNCDYYYELGLVLEEFGLLDEAVDTYKEYLEHSDYHGKDCERRIDSINKIINVEAY